MKKEMAAKHISPRNGGVFENHLGIIEGITQEWNTSLLRVWEDDGYWELWIDTNYVDPKKELCQEGSYSFVQFGNSEDEVQEHKDFCF